jgi:hypothetical protein
MECKRCDQTRSQRRANLLDPESVKEVAAKQSWEDKTRKLSANAYSKFLQVYGGTWTPPKCQLEKALNVFFYALFMRHSQY